MVGSGDETRCIPFSMSAYHENRSCLRLHPPVTCNRNQSERKAMVWSSTALVWRLLVISISIFVSIPMFSSCPLYWIMELWQICSSQLPPTSNCRVRAKKFVCKHNQYNRPLVPKVSLIFMLSLNVADLNIGDIWWLFSLQCFSPKNQLYCRVVYLNRTHFMEVQRWAQFILTTF